MSLFFILSGFVLVWSHRDGEPARVFFRRRLARLAPAYLVVLALFLVFRIVVLGRSPGDTFVHALPGVVALQSWIPSPSWFMAGNPVNWSLSDEMFFYLLFPLILRPLSVASARRLWCVVTALAATVVLVPTVLVLAWPEWIGSDTAQWAISVLPPTRLIEFMAGMAAGALVSQGARVPVPLPVAAIVASAAYLAAGWTPLWATYAVVTVVPFTLLIMTAAQRDTEGTDSPLAIRSFVRLGRWSYSFYLVHFLVIELANGAAKRLPSIATYPLMLLALAISIAASAVLFHFVENRTKNRSADSQARPAIHSKAASRT